MVGVILAQVVLRYGFHHGLVALEELIWHLYATAFLFGLGYAQVTDRHVRVDVLQSRLSPPVKNLLEILGILFLLLPMLWVIIDHSIDWAWSSYNFNESSENPTGLPYRWLTKAMVPAAFLLLLIAALSRLVQQGLRLAGRVPDGN